MLIEETLIWLTKLLDLKLQAVWYCLQEIIAWGDWTIIDKSGNCIDGRFSEYKVDGGKEFGEVTYSRAKKEIVWIWPRTLATPFSIAILETKGETNRTILVAAPLLPFVVFTADGVACGSVHQSRVSTLFVRGTVTKTAHFDQALQ